MRLILAALALALAGPALAQPDAGARAFVQGLYARYGDDSFCPTCAETRGQVFDMELAGYLAADEAATPEGEIGALGYDPICQCQDPEGLSARIDRVTAQPDGKVRAQVALVFNEGQPVDITLILARHGSGWRVYDVISADRPTLRGYLARAVRPPG